MNKFLHLPDGLTIRKDAVLTVSALPTVASENVAGKGFDGPPDRVVIRTMSDLFVVNVKDRTAALELALNIRLELEDPALVDLAQAMVAQNQPK